MERLKLFDDANHYSQIHKILKMAKVTYATAIKNAIVALKERTGSSLQAIKTYIAANHADNNANVNNLHKSFL